MTHQHSIASHQEVACCVVTFLQGAPPAAMAPGALHTPRRGRFASTLCEKCLLFAKLCLDASSLVTCNMPASQCTWQPSSQHD